MICRIPAWEKKISSLDALLNAQSSDRPLARELYLSDETFLAERERIFNSGWIFAAHEADLPQSDDFLTVSVLGTSIILCRNPDHEINAYFNVCRHRGSEICLDTQGKAKTFRCPYHGWSYSNEGQLLSAPFMPTIFDKEKNGLIPLSAVAVSGLIFVSMSNFRSSFERTQSDLATFIGPQSFANMKIAARQLLSVEANWKIVSENHRECYHCAGNHPELMRSMHVLKPGIEQKDDSEVVQYWSHISTLGLMPRASNEGAVRGIRVPLANGARSMTLNGDVAVNVPLIESMPSGIGAVRLALFPSFVCHILPDYAVTFRILPTSKRTTSIQVTWLVNQTAEEGRDFSSEELTAVWRSTNTQDVGLCESVQRGIENYGYIPGTYSALVEGSVESFISWYLSEMGKSKDDQRPT